MREKSLKIRKYECKIKNKKKFSITYEILVPGTLKRKSTSLLNSDDNWEEIIDICGAVISESKNPN